MKGIFHEQLEAIIENKSIMAFIVPMKALQQKYTYKFERMVDYYEKK